MVLQISLGGGVIYVTDCPSASSGDEAAQALVRARVSMHSAAFEAGEAECMGTAWEVMTAANVHIVRSWAQKGMLIVSDEASLLPRSVVQFVDALCDAGFAVDGGNLWSLDGVTVCAGGALQRLQAGMKRSAAVACRTRTPPPAPDTAFVEAQVARWRQLMTDKQRAMQAAAGDDAAQAPTDHDLAMLFRQECLCTWAQLQDGATMWRTPAEFFACRTAAAAAPAVGVPVMSQWIRIAGALPAREGATAASPEPIDSDDSADTVPAAGRARVRKSAPRKAAPAAAAASSSAHPSSLTYWHVRVREHSDEQWRAAPSVPFTRGAPVPFLAVHVTTRAPAVSTTSSSGAKALECPLGCTETRWRCEAHVHVLVGLPNTRPESIKDWLRAAGLVAGKHDPHKPNNERFGPDGAAAALSVDAACALVCDMVAAQRQSPHNVRMLVDALCLPALQLQDVETLQALSGPTAAVDALLAQSSSAAVTAAQPAWHVASASFLDLDETWRLLTHHLYRFYFGEEAEPSGAQDTPPPPPLLNGPTIAADAAEEAAAVQAAEEAVRNEAALAPPGSGVFLHDLEAAAAANAARAVVVQQLERLPLHEQRVAHELAVRRHRADPALPPKLGDDESTRTAYAWRHVRSVAVKLGKSFILDVWRDEQRVDALMKRFKGPFAYPYFRSPYQLWEESTPAAARAAQVMAMFIRKQHVLLYGSEDPQAPGTPVAQGRRYLLIVDMGWEATTTADTMQLMAPRVRPQLQGLSEWYDECVPSAQEFNIMCTVGRAGDVGSPWTRWRAACLRLVTDVMRTGTSIEVMADHLMEQYKQWVAL